jgi:outer membrane protein
MPALADALQKAQTHDPAMAAALADLKAAEQKTRAVGAEMRPDVLLMGTLTGRAGGAPATGGVTTPQGDGFLPSVPNWDVGVILSWPLFDGVIDARQDAARSVEQVRHDEIDIAREMEVARVRKTFAQVEVSRSAIVALQNQVLAARANYDQADARFRAGIGNAVELADAEAVRTDSDIQLAIGQFNLASARAAFGRAIAEGL